MKIYTKTGDSGETSLIGGTRVSKDHLRIESYGTVDELNSWIGVIASGRREKNILEVLSGIQNNLFTIGSHLAADPVKSRMVLPEITLQDIEVLEKNMDEMDTSLPALTNFVLPGGHPYNAYTHVARCVCRRAERLVVALHHESPVNELILKYLNRLSDYLFVLARYISWLEKVPEIPWITRKS